MSALNHQPTPPQVPETTTICARRVVATVVTQTREENGNNIIIIYVLTFYPHGSGDRHDLQNV